MTEGLGDEIPQNLEPDADKPVELLLTGNVTVRLTEDGKTVVASYIQELLPPTSYPPISSEDKVSLMPKITNNPDGTSTMTLGTFVKVMGSGLRLYPNAIVNQSLTYTPATQEVAQGSVGEK